MKLLKYILILSTGCLQTGHACLWDRDTLRQEYTGSESLVEVITGRFERFPDRYYEMRLERIRKIFDTGGGDLSLYDDAGVACDRLKRGDEAVEWMAKKKAEMDRQNLPEDHEHRYRYLANSGTFLFHRWIRRGGKLEEISEAKKGRDLIAGAIEINPDAHFGREKYQLMAMDWILMQKTTPGKAPKKSGDGTFLSYDSRDELRDRGQTGKAIEGVSGLIALGDAWRSPDVFAALGRLLHDRGDIYLGELVKLRIRELFDSGATSFAGKENESGLLFMGGYQVTDGSHKDIQKYFQRAREEAELWHAARWEYLEKQFAAGKHPDTDVDFWDGFSYRGEAPEPSKFDANFRQKALLGSLFFVVIIPVLVFPVLLIRKFSKK